VFEVNPSVLIPRPETEELVDLVIRTLTGKGLKILDIGTGSGCIAIALARRLKEAEVYAIDISGNALDTAERNAQRNGVAIHFVRADVLREIPPSLPLSFDVIVSNPPYVRECEKNGMHANVLNFEPHEALFVPDDDPLLFYRQIASIGIERLRPDGRLFFEINENCGKIVVEMLREKGYRDIELVRDLSGKDRITNARR
jgi:release factor glutamine methyltransferase